MILDDDESKLKPNETNLVFHWTNLAISV